MDKRLLGPSRHDPFQFNSYPGFEVALSVATATPLTFCEKMIAAETPDKIFSRITDRKSLYDAGTYILGLDDGDLTEGQRDFKCCYDLWLGLGNGFSDVCNGTYLASLPRGVAAFERIGVTTIAIPGRLVLAQFESRNLPTTEEEISDYTLDDADRERFRSAIEKIDAEFIHQIWDDGDNIEQGLIALASRRQEQTNTEQVGAQNP